MLRRQEVEPPPPDLPDRFDWPDRTVTWWQMWRESAQADHFTATDWDFLLDTALIHAQFWTGDTSVAAELRLRVAKFGATAEDRQRLKMTLEPKEAPVPSEVTRLDDYRSL